MNISLPTGSANSGQLEGSLSAGLGASSSNDQSGSSSFETVLSESSAPCSSTPCVEGKGAGDIAPAVPSLSRGTPAANKREQKGVVKTTSQPAREKDSTKLAEGNSANSEKIPTKAESSEVLHESGMASETLNLAVLPEKDTRPLGTIVGLDLIQGQLAAPMVVQPAISLPQVSEGLFHGQAKVESNNLIQPESPATGAAVKSSSEPVVINLAATSSVEPTVITHQSPNVSFLPEQGRTATPVTHQVSPKSAPSVQHLGPSESDRNVLRGEVSRQLLTASKAEVSQPVSNTGNQGSGEAQPISASPRLGASGPKLENIFPPEPALPTSPNGVISLPRLTSQAELDGKPSPISGVGVVPQVEADGKANENLGVIENLVSNPASNPVKGPSSGNVVEFAGSINQLQIDPLEGAQGQQVLVTNAKNSLEEKNLGSAGSLNAKNVSFSAVNVRSALRGELPKPLPINANPVAIQAGKNHVQSHGPSNKQPADVKVSTVASLLISQANGQARQGDVKVPNASLVQSPNVQLIENEKSPVFSLKSLAGNQPSEVSKDFSTPVNPIVQADSPEIRTAGSLVPTGETAAVKGDIKREGLELGLLKDGKVVFEPESFAEKGISENTISDQGKRPDQFSNEFQVNAAVPMSNASEKTAVQLVKTRGTGDAQQTSDMTMSANDEQKAEALGQNVPVSDADGSVAAIARQNLPNDESKKVKSDFETEWAGRLREVNSTSDVQLEQIDAALLEEVAGVRQPELAQEVWSAVEKFRLTDGKDWEVTIRPTHDTQIQLKLTTEGDQLIVHAKLDRGDLNALESGWSDLQAVLAERGVQLKPLEAATGQNWSGNSNSNNSFAQSNFEGNGGNKQKQPGFEFEQNRGRADVESFFTKQAAEQKKKNQPAPLKGGRGLETWA